MAVPVHLSSMPEHIRMPHLREVPRFSLNKQTESCADQQFLHFPATTYALWDSTSTGSPVFLHVVQHRDLKICVLERVLWLIHKQCEAVDDSTKVLVGSLTINNDIEGICFEIDEIDTQQGKTETRMTVGDVMVPVQVSKNRNQEWSGSVEDYVGAMKLLAQRCNCRDALELSNFMLLKGWFSFHEGNADKTIAHLQFDVVTMATVFKATPINMVPIVPTALAKNLSGPHSLSQVQGRPKSGYLTMDHTRKLLLVLETDPKVSSLPIVGIWVSGASMVHHPFVWAACLRYLHSSQLQDRICTPPEAFLLVLYSQLHSKPEFYEVNTVSGKPELEYRLYSGYEVTSFSKKSSGPGPTNIEWEVKEIQGGSKGEMFNAAIQMFKSQGRSAGGLNQLASSASSATDDIMPRSTPAPHTAKAMVVKPLVPEVSILWNDTPPVCNSQCPSSLRHDDGTASVSGQGVVDDVPRQFPPAGYTLYPSKPSVIRQPQASTNSKNHLVLQQKSNPASPSAVKNGGTTTVNEGRHYVYNIDSQSSQVNSLPVNAFLREGSKLPHLVPPASVNVCRPQPLQVQPRFPPYAAQAPTSNQRQMMTTPFPHQVHHKDTLLIPTSPENQQPLPQPLRAGMETTGACLHVCQDGLQSNQTGAQAHMVPQTPRHHVQLELGCQTQIQPRHIPVSPLSSELTKICPCPYPCSTVPGKSEGQMHVLGSCQHSPVIKSSQVQGAQMQSASYANPEFSVKYMAQMPDALQGPLGGLTSPSGSAEPHPAGFCMHFPPAGTQLSPRIGECGRETAIPAEITACSGRSSNDSGLSVTPNNSNPSPKRPTSPSIKTNDLEGAGAGSRISWDQVPPEVVQLLMQQDAQLKLLQAQIQTLMAQQLQHQQQLAASQGPASSSVMPANSPSSPLTLSKKPAGSIHSVAVNTTVIPSDLPCKPHHSTQCVSVQTSPQSSLLHTASQQDLIEKHGGIAVGTTSYRMHGYTPETEEEFHISTPNKRQDHQVADLSSTWIDEDQAREQSITHSPALTDNVISPRSGQQLSPFSNCSSPVSASMCADTKKEEESKSEISPHSPDYYDLVINNIHLFLNHQKNEYQHYQAADTSSKANNSLDMMELAISQSPESHSNPSVGGSSNTTLVPHINYFSMMLDSDSNTSMEISAMAMKYLRDDQLTKLARLRQGPISHQNSIILHQVLASGGNMADTLHLGGSGSNLSMATHQYMVRHGLLGDDGESMLDSNHTIQLQTNFSLAAASEANSTLSLDSSSRQPYFDPNSAHISPASRSPIKKELLHGQFRPSPAIPSGEEVILEKGAALHDLGASPIFHPPHIQGAALKLMHGDPAVEDFRGCPERYRPACLQDVKTSECSSATEKFLNIEKLKQMPKLL